MEIAIGREYSQIREHTKETKLTINKLVGTPIAIADNRAVHLLIKKINPSVKVITNSGEYEGVLEKIEDDKVTLRTKDSIYVINGYVTIQYQNHKDVSEIEAIELDPNFLTDDILYSYRTEAITWYPKLTHIIKKGEILTILFCVVESEFDRTIPGAKLIGSQPPEKNNPHLMRQAQTSVTEKSFETSPLIYSTTEKIYKGTNIFSLTLPISSVYEYYYVINLQNGHQEATKEIIFRPNINLPSGTHEFTTEAGLVFEVQKNEVRKGDIFRQSIGKTAEITAEVAIGITKPPEETRRLVVIDYTLNSGEPSIIYLRYDIGESQILNLQSEFPTFRRENYLYFEIPELRGKTTKRIQVELS